MIDEKKIINLFELLDLNFEDKDFFIKNFSSLPIDVRSYFLNELKKDSLDKKEIRNKLLESLDKNKSEVDFLFMDLRISYNKIKKNINSFNDRYEKIFDDMKI